MSRVGGGVIAERVLNLNFPPLFYKHGRIDKNYL